MGGRGAGPRRRRRAAAMGATLGSACGRRRQPDVPAETPFWEEVDQTKAAAREAEAEAGTEAGADACEAEAAEKQSLALGYEQAAHLKEEGKEKFARGDVEEAMESWAHALDALCAPPARPEDGACAPLGATPSFLTDPSFREMRLALFLNLAMGHKKLKQWRHAVNYCEEVLYEDPARTKALYHKASALGELCEWQEAEQTAARLEETGDEGKSLASKMREEWRRRRKAADGKQKKMWSTALSKGAVSPTKATEEAPELQGAPKEGPWAAPKVEDMSVFDLRVKGVKWNEKEDFDDELWRNGLGQKEATFYQQRALPLSLVAAIALGELSLQPELVVHCFLDGNTAPFAQPHDWSCVLRCCPQVRSLTVVYVDIGTIAGMPKDAPPVPYGTLLRPTEEGRVGDRSAHAARFMGTYREFKDHCRDLPGLVSPHLAFWADVPMYGFGDEDFDVRLEAFELLSSEGVPSVVTQGGEVPAARGPPIERRLDESASFCLAALAVGLRASTVVDWQWNRFVVPLDRGPRGILAAHALLGVVRTAPSNGEGKPTAKGLREALRRKGAPVPPAHALPPADMPPPEAAREFDRRHEQLRQKQWEVFCQRLKDAGRPVGPDVSDEEKNRQSMEFYQFCGMND